MKCCPALLLFILPCSVFASVTTDTLNRVNANGKRDGFWITYLDSLLSPVADSNAYYYAYDLYDNGDAVFKFQSPWKFGGKLIRPTGLPVKGHPVLLEGVFICRNSKMQLVDSLVFSNGFPVFIGGFQYNENGGYRFTEEIYFNRPYQNQRGTFYYEERSADGVIYKGYYYKGKRGWRTYPEPEYKDHFLKPNLGIKGSYYYRGYSALELGVSITSYIGEHRIQGKKLGVKGRADLTLSYDLGLGAKVRGWRLSSQLSYRYFTTRVSAARFNEQGTIDIRIIPEAGISFRGLVNLCYGYSLPLGSKQIKSISPHSISLILAF